MISVNKAIKGKRSSIIIFTVDMLLWCLLCILIVQGLVCLDSIKRYSSASLRYDTPISGRDAYAARLFSIAHSDEGIFWPTFWNEYIASFSSELAVVDAGCIAFSGDAALVYPVVFVFGAAPGSNDGSGCAVSEMLAWRLWGGTDVVGMTVMINESERIVRGVFKGEWELALISFSNEGTAQDWSAAELSGGPDNFTRDDARSYAIASGLGNPAVILMGGQSLFAGIMMILPLIILAIYGISLAAGYAGKRFPTLRKFYPYLLMIAIAALMPIVLGMIPEWLIPTRWSDFTFWGSMLRQAASGLHEFLSAAPRSRDVELRLLIIKQAGIMLVSVCLSIAVCFRWQIRRGENYGGYSSKRHKKSISRRCDCSAGFQP